MGDLSGWEIFTVKKRKNILYICLGIAAVMAVILGVFMLTGDIDVQFRRENIFIDASYYADIAVRYEDIDSVRYFEEADFGTFKNGFASLRLAMGTYESEQFETYTRYTYSSSKSCVGIAYKGNILILSGRDETETKAIYEELVKRRK